MTVEQEQWRDVLIGDLGEIVGGGTPSRAMTEYWGGDIAWITPGELSRLSTKYVTSTREQISVAGLAASAAKVLPIGSLLVTTRATLGEIAIAAIPVSTNQGFKSIVPNADTDALFAYYKLQTCRTRMRQLASGTTFLEISKADFARILTRFPRVLTQQRIASVLELVDDAVENSSAAIHKRENARAGLLQDLMSRGLSQNGALRDPEKHPNQFCGSALGPVPSEWEVAPLRRFLDGAEYGISSSLHTDGTLPVLRMNNLSGGEASLSDVKFASVTIPDSLLLRDGDVLFNRTNSFEHVGRTGIWRAQLPKATFASYLVRLNPSKKRLDSEFLNLLLNMPDSQRRMRRYATPAVQQVNINPTSLQQMVVAVPKDLEEQRLIVKLAATANAQIQAERGYHHKLTQLRQGLSADLLSGRVHVPAEVPIVAEAV